MNRFPPQGEIPICSIDHIMKAVTEIEKCLQKEFVLKIRYGIRRTMYLKRKLIVQELSYEFKCTERYIA